MKSPHTGIKRILKAFVYSYDGMKAAFKSEAAFRQDVLFCVLCLPLLWIFPVNAIQVGLMCFALIFILAMELVNTAVEAVVDRIGAEFHALSKKAKDIGSALVLLAFINWAIIWGGVVYMLWVR